MYFIHDNFLFYLTSGKPVLRTIHDNISLNRTYRICKTTKLVSRILFSLFFSIIDTTWGSLFEALKWSILGYYFELWGWKKAGKATQLEPNITGFLRDFKRARYQKLAFVDIYIYIWVLASTRALLTKKLASPTTCMQKCRRPYIDIYIYISTKASFW